MHHVHIRAKLGSQFMQYCTQNAQSSVFNSSRATLNVAAMSQT